MTTSILKQVAITKDPLNVQAATSVNLIAANGKPQVAPPAEPIPQGTTMVEAIPQPQSFPLPQAVVDYRTDKALLYHATKQQDSSPPVPGSAYISSNQLHVEGQQHHVVAPGAATWWQSQPVGTRLAIITAGIFGCGAVAGVMFASRWKMEEVKDVIPYVLSQEDKKEIITEVVALMQEVTKVVPM
jgi:hypothetical protein